MDTKQRSGYALVVIVAVVSIMASGCASSGPKREKRRLFFPKPPGQPKIEYIDTFSSQLDFPRSKFKIFMDNLFGQSLPRVFAKPYDVASNGNGKIYISDLYRPGLYVYNIPKKSMKIVEGKMLGYVPQGLHVDGDGNVYITNTRNNRVNIYDRDEKPLYSIKAELNWPIGVTTDDKNGKIYVANSHGHNVTIYDKEGKHLSTIGGRGSGKGEFNFPVDVDVARDGTLVVADSMNARIQVFSAEGKFLRHFGKRGDNPSNFSIIKGVAVDSEDHIYISDSAALNIKIFDMKGNFLMTLGGKYITKGGKTAPAGFAMPSGIHVDKKNGIYIADQLNNNFQVFQYLDEDYLKRHPVK